MALWDKEDIVDVVLNLKNEELRMSSRQMSKNLKGWKYLHNDVWQQAIDIWPQTYISLNEKEW